VKKKKVPTKKRDSRKPKFRKGGKKNSNNGKSGRMMMMMDHTKRSKIYKTRARETRVKERGHLRTAK